MLNQRALLLQMLLQTGSFLRAGLFSFFLAGAVTFSKDSTGTRDPDFEELAGDFCYKHGFDGLMEKAEDLVRHPLAVQKAARAVWWIKASLGNGMAVGGSGFFLNRRILVTNFHVLESFGEADLKDIVLSRNGEPGEIGINRLIATSAVYDVAFLETDRDAPAYLSLRETALAEKENVFVLGYPWREFRILRKTGPLMRFVGFMEFPVNYAKELTGLSGGPATDSEGYVSGILHKSAENSAVFTEQDRLNSVLEGSAGVRCKNDVSHKECLNEALRLASKRAETGDTAAQFDVGYRRLLRGKDGAVYWINRAAEQGHVTAQYYLGSMYYDGKGVEQNLEKALYWTKKAAEQGHAVAQHALGNMYYDGEGVEQNLENALYWTKKAAEQGHLPSQFNLGFSYLNSEDFKRAAVWMTKTAEQGDATARFNLGLMHFYGDGVEKNFEKTVYWMSKAAEQGYATALEYLFTADSPLSSETSITTLLKERLCAQP